MKNSRRAAAGEIVAIVLLAAAVLVILSLYTHAAGNVGAAPAHWLERYLGRSAVFPALFLLGLGWSLLSQRTRAGRGRRVTALFIIYIAALTGYHLVVTEIDGPLNEYWLTQVGEEGRGGGFVGAVLSVWALRAFGPWGSAVVLIAAALIGAVLYLETPISRLAAASVRLARPRPPRGDAGVGRLRPGRCPADPGVFRPAAGPAPPSPGGTGGAQGHAQGLPEARAARERRRCRT